MQKQERSRSVPSGVPWIVVALGLCLVFPSQALQPSRARVDVSALGPQVGQTVPDFNLPDQHGTIRTLESIMGPNGAMLVFHRSADW
jgi:hypothetical protein